MYTSGTTIFIGLMLVAAIVYLYLVCITYNNMKSIEDSKWIRIIAAMLWPVLLVMFCSVMLLAAIVLLIFTPIMALVMGVDVIYKKITGKPLILDGDKYNIK